MAANRRLALERTVFKVIPAAKSMTSAWQPTAAGIGAGGEAPPGAVKFYAAYDADGQLAGIAAEGAAKGYADTVRIMFGYSPGCQCIIGFGVVAMSETPGIGDKIVTDKAFLANFEALDAKLNAELRRLANEVKDGQARQQNQPWQIDAIAGATVTSRAVGKAINDARKRCAASGAADRADRKYEMSDHLPSTAPDKSLALTWDDFMEGIWRQNPVFVMVLGMCPTLAVTVSAVNALSMGVATASRAGVLLPAGVADAQRDAQGGAHRHLHRDHRHLCHRGRLRHPGDQPGAVRRARGLHPADRGELHHPRPRRGACLEESAADGDGQRRWHGRRASYRPAGARRAVREILGAGTLFGVSLFGADFQPWVVMVLPPGGFFVLGSWLLLFSGWSAKRASCGGHQNA